MKKIFTMKRVILIMSLILVYSFAFLFVKIYAEKSIITSGEPSNASLYVPDDTHDTEEPAETEAAEEISEPEVSVSDETPSVEQLINKEYAAQALMRIAAATSVEDTIDIVTTEKTAETTAPTTTAIPATTTTLEVTTTTPTTEPPKTTTSAQTTEPDEEEIVENDDNMQENIDGEMDEDVIPDENVDASDDDYNIMTPEELEDLLERLGLGSVSNGGTGAGTGSASYPSYGSYKNETVTIYDLSRGALRTDNAFDLVCEITNNEVGGGMDPEAIKAQAVAAYTYIKYYEQRGEYAQLATKSNPSSSIINAVEAIDGLAIYYNGNYIFSPFSASQGGYSAASKNVWGGDLPYLQSVQNDFDYLDTTHYGVSTSYTVEDLRQRIESKTDIKLSNNYSEWIRVLSYNDQVYAGQLSIDGHTSAYINGRERTITGYIFRTYILNIKSTNFTVSYADGVFTFTTYGYGHGVGLSQIGANLYAKYGGYTFDQILMHYFTGVTIK